jgi:hypothetical protein
VSAGFDPEERGARRIFRAVFIPRFFADFLWRVWLHFKRRRDARVSKPL